eukprot:4024896-Prymnesium_polylepis.1
MQDGIFPGRGGHALSASSSSSSPEGVPSHDPVIFVCRVLRVCAFPFLICTSSLMSFSQVFSRKISRRPISLRREALRGLRGAREAVYEELGEEL